MSIGPVFRITLIAIVNFLVSAAVHAGSIQQVDLTVHGGERPFADVSGGFADLPAGGRRSIVFVNTHAGVSGLVERISRLRVFGKEGEIAYRSSPEGAVFADEDILSFSYSVDLSPQDDVTLGAHVSWFKTGKGALMLFDLLPISGINTKRTKVRLIVPDGTEVVTLLEQDGEGNYTTREIEDAVFVLSGGYRHRVLRSGKMQMGIAVEGEWQFGDDVLYDSVEMLLKNYGKIFAGEPDGPFQLTLMRVPDPAMKDRWRAETRGRNILVLASPSRYRNVGEQLVLEQVRHELLHLWVPNSLGLQGDYSWFYEGFVFYRALIEGVSEKHITLRDVLASLRDVHRRATISEWAPLAGYEGGQKLRELARGALVAFAMDIALIKSGRDLDDLLVGVFKGAQAAEKPADANDLIVSIMMNDAALAPVVRRSVTGSDAPDWAAMLQDSGILEGRGVLTVDPRPSSRQKVILRRLGYNGNR